MRCRFPWKPLGTNCVTMKILLSLGLYMVEREERARHSATARAGGSPPDEIVMQRTFDVGVDSLRLLEALADDRNVDLQVLVDEAFTDLLKKHGRL